MAFHVVATTGSLTTRFNAFSSLKLNKMIEKNMIKHTHHVIASLARMYVSCNIKTYGAKKLSTYLVFCAINVHINA